MSLATSLAAKASHKATTTVTSMAPVPPLLIAIGGPTASGKSAMAVELAQQLGADIINADSRLFYKGLNIGTAKPNEAELARAKHWFVDTLEPDEDYTAGRYSLDALQFLNTHFKTQKTAIAVGGSGLYLQALCRGFDTAPSVDPAVRARWNKQFETGGIVALQNALEQLDPRYFAVVDKQNHRRLLRALELIETTKKPMDYWQLQAPPARPFRVFSVCIMPPRDWLYHQINLRTELMFKAGFVNEVRGLAIYRNCQSMQSVGYTEVLDYLDGKIDLDICQTLVAQHTRQYAKRQFTWFKKQPNDLVLSEPDSSAVMKHLKRHALV